MFTSLPILVFISIFLNILGRQHEVEYNFIDWRGAFLKASVAWGGLVAIYSELLSLFDSLVLYWLAILWGLTFIALCFYGFRQGVFYEAWKKIKRIQVCPIGWLDRVVLAILVAIVLLLFAIAWVAIPNTTDSLHYHMSRVMHWAQNGSLKHYPTQYQYQHWNPPWAELVILQLRILWGNDRLANMVQWFSMVGSLVGISAVAGLLGVSRRGQLLAATFVATIPMGILQATSTQNDYVTAFWLVCLAYFVILSKKRELHTFEWLTLGVATGLGLLTKGTFYLYTFPILLWYFIPRIREQGSKKTVLEGVAFTSIVVILNLGYWLRNTVTYGNPLGAGIYVADKTKLRLYPQLWISATIDQVALNFISSIPRINSPLQAILKGVNQLLGVDHNHFYMISAWNHEDLSPNTLHMLLIFITLFVFVLVRKQIRSKLISQSMMIFLGSFLFFSLVVDFDPYGVRYQLPFIVLWGSIFGAIASSVNLKKLTYLVAILMIISSLPWLLMNRTRNVIGFRPYTSLGESVFREPPEFVLLANWNELRGPFLDVTEAVKSTGCKEVGLKIDSHDLEYPYWWLLEAPQSGIRIEAIDPPIDLERYIDPSFSPCAIICTICADRDRYHGLERVGGYGEGIVLFVGSNYSPDEDG